MHQNPISVSPSRRMSMEAASSAGSPNATGNPSAASPRSIEGQRKLLKMPFDLKREEDLKESDFSMYDDINTPFMYVCRRFVYMNKALIERDKAIAEYRERSRSLSPYDAIAPPPGTWLNGRIIPFRITDELRPRLIELCNLALEKYNADNQGANFVFDDVVKTTGRLVPGYIYLYYITFEAKDATHPLNGTSRTFQAQVWDKVLPRGAEPVVQSCSMKPT